MLLPVTVFLLSLSCGQRLNGRMAMLGFAGIALAELKNGVPAAEQLGGDVFGVLLLSITFTLASLFPKFSTGSSLKVRCPACVHHYAVYFWAWLCS